MQRRNMGGRPKEPSGSRVTRGERPMTVQGEAASSVVSRSWQEEGEGGGG